MKAKSLTPTLSTAEIGLRFALNPEKEKK